MGVRVWVFGWCVGVCGWLCACVGVDLGCRWTCVYGGEYVGVVGVCGCMRLCGCMGMCVGLRVCGRWDVCVGVWVCGCVGVCVWVVGRVQSKNESTKPIPAKISRRGRS